MKRREFLIGGAQAVVLGLAAPSVLAEGRRPGLKVPDNEPLLELDRFFRETMQRDHIPGVAACILNRDKLLWTGSYGWADIRNNVPMSLDGLQNMASISKTFTATAVMQLFEAGLIQLDADVNDYLEFRVRHPKAAKQPITVKQLLTHTSAIADGPAYSTLYACGDPRLSLATWLREYFTPGGHYYDRDRNFHPWLPNARKYAYCNLAYGLLARVVEIVSGTPFDEYCESAIFSPLGMRSTSWRIADIDQHRHTVPYTWVEAGKARGPDWGGRPLGVIEQDGPTYEDALGDGFHPNCVYGHPNYPDGFLRSSVNDLSRYLQAYLSGGARDGYRLLKRATIEQMLSEQVEHEWRTREGQARHRSQGLTWSADGRLANDLAWGHAGSDPGVNTDMRILTARGLGAIVFCNTNGIDAPALTTKLLEVAQRASLSDAA